MNVGVGVRMRGVIAAAVALGVIATRASMRDAPVPQIHECADRACRSNFQSPLLVQEGAFADGVPHFAGVYDTIAWDLDLLDACRIQNPGYWTEVFLNFRPQHSTRTWIVETTIRGSSRGAPTNDAVARCFKRVFEQYLNDGRVSPEAIDAWRDTRAYFQSR